jgi:hypothetical protein
MATTPAYFGDYSDREQPTLNSVAKFIKDARVELQDVVEPYRYDDDSLLDSLNQAMLEGARLRPDLFVFNITVDGQIPAFQAVDDTYVAIEPQFRQAFVRGLCAHAMERDQEDYQDSRASAFWGMFTAGLVGHGIGPVAGGTPPGGKRGER